MGLAHGGRLRPRAYFRRVSCGDGTGLSFAMSEEARHELLFHHFRQRINKLREDVQSDDKTSGVKHNFARGYGGKFGVEQVRLGLNEVAVGGVPLSPLTRLSLVITQVQDKSALGNDYQAEKSVHSSQIDGKKGFGGEFGLQGAVSDAVSANNNNTCSQPIYRVFLFRFVHLVTLLVLDVV